MLLAPQMESHHPALCQCGGRNDLKTWTNKNKYYPNWRDRSRGEVEKYFCNLRQLFGYTIQLYSVPSCIMFQHLWKACALCVRL